jgi:hypothetical protein
LSEGEISITQELSSWKLKYCYEHEKAAQMTFAAMFGLIQDPTDFVWQFVTMDKIWVY